MKLVRILTVVFAMFLSYGAYADSDYWMPRDCEDTVEIEYGIQTVHLISDRSKVNEDNRFTAVTAGCWQFASFINSYHDQTYAIGRAVTMTDNFSIGFGLIKGYGVHTKSFPDIFILADDLLWYIEPEVKLWASNLGINARWADNVGVKTRLLGEVWQSSLTARVEF